MCPLESLRYPYFSFLHVRFLYSPSLVCKVKLYNENVNSVGGKKEKVGNLCKLEDADMLIKTNIVEEKVGVSV